MNLPRRCLQIDIGNSSAKWRLQVEGATCARGRYSHADENSLQVLLDCSEELDAIWISSVAADYVGATLASQLFEHWHIKAWFARSETDTDGLRNAYHEPQRLGVDRWLAMLAARRCWPDEALCVVDAGSALTIDLVAADGQHSGGYILPGPQLMERALLQDTDRVRFSEAARYCFSPGTSTAQAVRHGIAIAQAGAVAQALQQLPSAGTKSPRVITTGGGGLWLAEHLSMTAIYQQDLVLEGLQLMGQLKLA
ncbi:MAG: type III pantothenate kinase [Parahaliea sp.]